MVIKALLIGSLLAANAEAVEKWTQGIDGVGRVSIAAGWKLAGNDWFFNQSRDLGYPVVSRGIGGPQGSMSFGYGATSFIEAAIDLFIGHDRFQLEGYDPINVLTYGALVGVRFTYMDLFFRGFAPFVGVGVGPTLGYATANGAEQTIEKLSTGIAGTVGLTYRMSERVGLSLEYRYLYARGNWLTSGVNVGGSWFSLAVVIYFGRTVGEAESMLGR